MQYREICHLSLVDMKEMNECNPFLRYTYPILTSER